MDCDTASRRIWSGFRAGCRGCCARAASRSPQYRSASLAGIVDRPYRLLLEQFGLTHAEVRAAAQADFEQRAGSAAA